MNFFKVEHRQVSIMVDCSGETEYKMKILYFLNFIKKIPTKFMQQASVAHSYSCRTKSIGYGYKVEFGLIQGLLNSKKNLAYSCFSRNTKPLTNKERITVEVRVHWIEERRGQVKHLCYTEACVTTRYAIDLVTAWGVLPSYWNCTFFNTFLIIKF